VTTFLQTSTNDFDLSTGNLVLVTDPAQQIAIVLQNRLQFFEGEWFLDTRLGVPYFQFVLVKNPDLQLITRMFIKIALAIEGVVQVLEMTPSFNTAARVLTMTMRILTSTGAVISGGTIPDRGLFTVMTPGGADGAGSRVGELDEEMVYESRVGDTFLLGTSSWRVEDITHDRVIVTPAPGQPARMPFWKGDAIGRPLELGRAVGAFVREMSGLGTEAARQRATAAGLDEWAVDNLLSYLDEQRQATRHVPSDRTVLVERFRDELGDWRMVVHSPFGAQVNGPWALAIAARMRERRGVENVFEKAVELLVVVVHDHREVLQLVIAREHGGFPVLSFFNLAIADHDEGVEVFLVEPGRERHADADGDSLSQRAGIGFEHGKKPFIRMALERRAEFAQSGEDGVVNVSGVGKNGVKRGTAVTLGQDEAVAVRPLRVGRIDPHGIEIKLDDQLNRRKRTTGMPRFGRAGHFNNVAAYTLGDRLKFRNGFGHVKILILPSGRVEVRQRMSSRQYRRATC